MVKNAIILVLLAALAAAAFVTRPSDRDFRSLLANDSPPAARRVTDVKSALKDILISTAAGGLGGATDQQDGLDYKDRWLWVDVQRDGKTLYTGAFGHWFKRSAAAR